MSRAFYPGTLLLIEALMRGYDSDASRKALEDGGLEIESISLTDSTGDNYIGWIEFDTDGHPKFRPAD